MTDVPNWWKPDRPEYAGNPVLHACAKAQMGPEEALDNLALYAEEIGKRLQAAIQYSCPSSVVIVESKEDGVSPPIICDSVHIHDQKGPAKYDQTPSEEAKTAPPKSPSNRGH